MEDMKYVGFEKILGIYIFNCETTAGQLADDLVENMEECFQEPIEVPLIMSAIQKFRQWDFERDEREGEQIFADVNFVDDGHAFLINDFQDYMYFDGTFVPEDTRIGIEIDGELVLDKGIFFASDARTAEKTEKCVLN